MREIVLVTQPLWERCRKTLEPQQEVEAVCVPDSETEVVEAIRRRRSRVLILHGALCAGSAMYEALGQAAQGRGALIARYGVGFDNVNGDLCRRHGITLTNTPGVLEASVAEHAFWLAGCLARGVRDLHAAMQAGQWTPRTGTELCQKVLGIVGLGAIGRRVARIAKRGFDMKVIGIGRRSPQQMERDENASIADICDRLGLDQYGDDVEKALPQCDLVSLHLPGCPATRNFISASRLALCKPSALLINTARGSVVDEIALYDALAAGRLAGAALDVFAAEPYVPATPDKDLRRLDNVLLTPHVGSNTADCNDRMAARCLRNILAFVRGQRQEMDIVY